MDNTNYSVIAQFYDSVYDSVAPQDIEFYLELAARSGGPVLELGCGTGRVTLPLARAGFEVTALDLSPSMLGLLAQKLSGESSDVAARVTVVEGDMASFELDRRFALIITPFRAYQHLMTPALQRACLRRVAAHLAEDGRFVYNAFNPSPLYMVEAIKQGPTWRMDFEGKVGDSTLRRYVLLDYDFAGQVLKAIFRFERFTADGRLEATYADRIEMRWQYRWEAEYLLELCGLEIVEAYGDYRGQAIDGGKELIYVTRRATQDISHGRSEGH